MLNDLNNNETAKLLENMIEEICLNFDMTTKNAIGILAQYYRVDRNKIVNILKNVNSVYVSNNSVVYYDDRGIGIKRTNHLAKVMKTIDKIGRNIKKLDIDIDSETLIDIIKTKYEVPAYAIV